MLRNITTGSQVFAAAARATSVFGHEPAGSNCVRTVSGPLLGAKTSVQPPALRMTHPWPRAMPQ